MVGAGWRKGSNAKSKEVVKDNEGRVLVVEQVTREVHHDTKSPELQ